VFYFSRAEQAALVALVALLLAGTGVLVYQRGKRAGAAAGPAPLLVEAPAVEAADAAPAGREAPGAPEADDGKDPHWGNARQPAQPSPASRIHLNTATARDLEALPGIGPVLAQRIVQRRQDLVEQRGHGFESVDELLSVPGIGAKRLAAIRDLVAL